MFVIFWKFKLCHAWPNSTIFRNRTFKNIPNWQQCVRFRKSLKNSLSLHPTVRTMKTGVSLTNNMHHSNNLRVRTHSQRQNNNGIVFPYTVQSPQICWLMWAVRLSLDSLNTKVGGWGRKNSLRLLLLYYIILLLCCKIGHGVMVYYLHYLLV